MRLSPDPEVEKYARHSSFSLGGHGDPVTAVQARSISFVVGQALKAVTSAATMFISTRRSPTISASFFATYAPSTNPAM